MIGRRPMLRSPGKNYSYWLDLLRWRLRLLGALKARLGLGKRVYIGDMVARYQEIWGGAAGGIGAEFEALDEAVWEVRRGGQTARLAGFVTQFDDPVTLRVAGDKWLTLRLVASVGVPVTHHMKYDLGSLSDAFEFLHRSPVPCVVKPMLEGGGSVGVTTGVRTRSELKRASVMASLVSRQLLIEQTVTGEVYRLLFVNGGFVHAIRRRGVRVVGDGHSTVRRLVGQHVGAPSIQDPSLRDALRGQELTPDDVPADGRSVLLGDLASARARAESPTRYDEDVTAEISGALLEEAQSAVSVIGSRYAGVDVVTPDCTRSLKSAGGAFIELNTTPGLHQHFDVMSTGRTLEVGEIVLEHLLARLKT